MNRMVPTHYQTQVVRPAESGFLIDTISAGKDYMKKLVAGVDAQTVLPIAAFAATLGLGTAAFYLGRHCRDTHNDHGGTSLSSNKRRSKIDKKRNKKSNRVVFQSPLEKDSFTLAVENYDDGELLEDEPTPSAMDLLKDSDASVGDVDKSNNNKSASVGEKPVRENILILKQCPRGRKTPCIAPFPLKLETFLRVHKIKFELDFSVQEPRAFGSSPWIRFNTEDITDSQQALYFLIDQYDLTVEKGLTAEQRSMATAYSHLLENHLYWGIALWRWVYDGARSLKDIQLLPKETRDLIPDVCKTVEQAAWFHGIGKLSPEEVKREVIRDLSSLSEFLGSKDYFLGTSTPTELDCTAFGMLAQFLWNMQGPFQDAIMIEFKNLRDFCWRMRLDHWPDWEECLNNTQYYTNDPYPTSDSVEYPF